MHRPLKKQLNCMIYFTPYLFITPVFYKLNYFIDLERFGLPITDYNSVSRPATARSHIAGQKSTTDK